MVGAETIVLNVPLVPVIVVPETNPVIDKSPPIKPDPLRNKFSTMVKLPLTVWSPEKLKLVAFNVSTLIKSALIVSPVIVVPDM